LTDIVRRSDSIDKNFSASIECLKGGKMMASEITILGSGTCVPSLKRAPCSFLMKTGGQRLLFDCGPGIMRRLLEAGGSIFDVSHIFLSHFHPDHVGEFASFLFALKYPEPSSQKQLLTVVAGQGIHSFLERMTAVYGKWIVLPPDRFRVIELSTEKPDSHQFEQFTVFSIPVVHRPESLAYRILDRRQKALVYSGDTDECKNLVDISLDADLMICESAFPDDEKIKGHLTPSIAGKIAQKANVKRLMLTHFYPACDNVDIENQCRRTYNGSIVLAEDLLRLTL
jgi:ribonuclease BN (tRNA processing enzyme)